VLTEFISTGVYDRNRPFHLTTSPSMDILISSNLERLLYMLSGSDSEVKGYMASLGAEGKYQVSDSLKEGISRWFDCGFADDAMAAASIKEVFDVHGYLADPHTAVAINVYNQYVERTGDHTPTVIASTASPFKFPGSVLDALGVQKGGDDFDMLNAVSAISGRAIPPRLAELKDKAVRFEGAVNPADMKKYVSQLMK